MAEWIATTIGEQLTLQRGHDITRAEQRPGSIPVVSSGGVSSYHDTSMSKGPGVVIGRKGTLGTTFFMPSEYWPHDTTLWVKDFKGNYERFVYYFFVSMSKRMLALDNGSANPTLNRNHVHPTPVKWPPLREQRAIAAVLGSLDDKIEVNRRTARVLEGIARAVFTSWFVDFDPVRRRAAPGSGPVVPLPADLAAFFPKRLVDSPIGEVPEGWGTEPMSSHFEVVRGLSYKGSGLAESGLPMHNLNSVYEGGGYKYPGIKFYSGDYRDRHMLDAGDVIVANTEQGHDHLLIGYPAIVPKRFGEKGLFSHHLYRVRPKAGSPLTARYIFQAMMTPRLRDEIIGHTNGTTVNMLSITGLEMPRVVVPPGPLVKRFDDLAKSLLERIELMHDANPVLAGIRDALLPKLISGELRIDDAERIVGRAV